MHDHVSRISWSEAEEAEERVRAGETDWRGAWFCLHGLLSITPVGMSEWISEVIEGLRPALPEARDGWLAAMSQIAPTGEAWRVVDAYGTRIGLAAEFQYPEPAEPMIYLLDFDISGFPRLESAGVHDALDHAVTAWRDEVGPSAAGAGPRPIGDGADVAVLTYWDMGELFVTGFESRTVMDNWYRSQRRADDLIAALAKRGVDLPKHRSPAEELDIEPTVTAFTTWYAAHHHQAPALEPTEALAAEWLETALPGTEVVLAAMADLN